MRVIVFTGKGGSGVSTLAAATAVAAARGGGSVLAMGLGSGLAAALGVSLGPEPRGVVPGLRAVELGPQPHGAFLAWLRDLLAWRNMDEELAEDIAALPGLADLSRLLEVEAAAFGGEAELVVVDAPPLRPAVDLLAALDAAPRWLDRLFPPRQPTLLEPFLRAISGYSTAGDQVYEDARGLLLRLCRLRDLLRDGERSSLRLVLSPDRSALAEARGALSALALCGYPVDAAICNGLLPPEAADSFLGERFAAQQEALAEMAAGLAPLPLLSAPLRPRPPVGPEPLVALAGELYAGRDPPAVLHRGPGHTCLSVDGRQVLALTLPFARREEIRVEHLGESLIVHLAGRQHTISLPAEVRGLEPLSSSYDGATLRVTFGPRQHIDDTRSER